MKNMNAKYKTPLSGSSVRRTLGRPVGILPLSSRPVPPGKPWHGTGLEKAQIKRTPSTGSISSLKSVRSARSDCGGKAKNGKKGVATELEDEEELVGQDVKFFNIESTSRPVSASSLVSSVRTQAVSLSTQDILDRSQEADPYKVYEIVLHGEELQQIPDLEKFRKLRVLDISGNKIRQIHGLEFNKDLRDLKLYDNEISVLEGFENLKELCNLQLQHNKITKIGKAFSNLKKLTSLRLDNNKLTKLDTPELVSCANICVLDLSNNKIESLAPLNYLPKLEELLASGNSLRKVADLSKCKRLQEIDLSHNLLSELGGIANLPNLQKIDVSYNQLDSLKSVGKLRSLEELNVNANKIKNLHSFVSAFPKLQILFICDNMIERWDEVCVLSNMTELVELFVSANPFTFEEGGLLTYHLHISEAVPSLEIIDGIPLKKSNSKQAAAPLMRPMSAASVISVKQVDSQLKSVTQEQESYHKDISERFESLRSIFNTLPSESPRGPRPSTVESTSRCSSRARLLDAKRFASTNFESDNEDD